MASQEQQQTTSEVDSHQDPVAFATINRIVHDPARLVILAALNKVDEADFKYLLLVSGLTKGNVSRHTSILENAGYITIRKYYKGKIPATTYRITEDGKRAFATYWEQMSALQRSSQDATHQGGQ